MPPGTSAPSRAARAPRATPKIVASGVVTASQSDEERTLTGTPSGLATNEEGTSGSLGVSWSEEASGSAEVPAPATDAASASSDQADSSYSTSGAPAKVPTPASDQPNRWHDITALGLHARSDDICCGMTSPPLNSTHGRMMSGLA